MPTERSIHLPCPHCGHAEAALISRSHTVITVTCRKCQYAFAVGIEGMPESVLREAQLIILERSLSSR